MRCDVRPKRGREGRKEGNNNFTFFQSGQSSCQGPTELGEEERDYPGRSFLRLDIQITEGRGEERREATPAAVAALKLRCEKHEIVTEVVSRGN